MWTGGSRKGGTEERSSRQGEWGGKRISRKGLRAKGAKGAGSGPWFFVWMAVDDALDAVLQDILTKVDLKPQFSIAKAELCEELLPTDWKKGLDRFDLHNHYILDDRVCPETLLKPKVVINNGDRDLALDLQPALPRFVGENHFIHCLEHARPNFLMQSERNINNGPGNSVFVHRPALPKRKSSRKKSRKSTDRANNRALLLPPFAPCVKNLEPGALNKLLKNPVRFLQRLLAPYVIPGPANLVSVHRLQLVKPLHESPRLVRIIPLRDILPEHRHDIL